MRSLLVFIGLFAVILGGVVNRALGAGHPNVLFLFTDDQRADTIHELGNETILTPSLDQIAQSGFVFRNAYCMGSTLGAVCQPSRHMMHSGMSLFRYDPKKKKGTFGDVMRRAGYETYHQSKQRNTPQLYHTAFEHSSYLDDVRERNSGHHGRTAANDAIHFLKHTWKKDRPFFMYIGFAGPHDPRVADTRWLGRYDRRTISLPANYQPFHPFDNGELLVRDEKLASWPRTEDTVRRHIRDYYACISSIDHNIGRMITALKDLGEFENTIIVFSSDHGLALGSHGLFGKQNVYEHSMKAPLFFSGPGIPHGESNAFAYLFDIFPTVVDLVGGKVPDGLDGISLAPVIHGQKNKVRDTIFLAYKSVQRAVRKDDWKLICYPRINKTQLFHLSEDPHELKDLADDATQADRLSKMMAILREQQKQFGDFTLLTSESPEPALIDETYFQ